MKKFVQFTILTFCFFLVLFGIAHGLANEFEERTGSCCQPATIDDPVYQALSTNNNQARLTNWNVSFVTEEQVQVITNEDPNFPICGPCYVLLSSQEDGDPEVFFQYENETFNNPAVLVGHFDICKRAVLRFKFQFTTTEACVDNEDFNDIFLVLIESSFGQEEILKRRPNPDCSGLVEDFSLDLQKYFGQTITITFLAANKGDGLFATFAKIDCFEFIDPCPNCPCNDLCCSSGSQTRCYNAQTHTCIDGKLCGIGTLPCGRACFNPDDYGCCTSSSGNPYLCQKIQASPPTFFPCPEGDPNPSPCVSFSVPNFQTGDGFVYYDPRCTLTPSISGCRPDLPANYCRNCRITTTGTAYNECPPCVRDIFAPYF